MNMRLILANRNAHTPTTLLVRMYVMAMFPSILPIPPKNHTAQSSKTNSPLKKKLARLFILPTHTWISFLLVFLSLLFRFFLRCF